MRLCLVPLVTLLSSGLLESQQVQIAGYLGYARSLQFSELDGGPTIAGDISKSMGTTGLRVGLSFGYFGLGSSNTSTASRWPIPPNPLLTRTERKARSGWYGGILASAPLGFLPAHTLFTGEARYYSIRFRDSSTLRDSSGTDFRPPTSANATSVGPGIRLGLSIPLVAVSRRSALHLAVGTTATLLHTSTGSDPGWAFIQYLDVGLRLTLGI